MKIVRVLRLATHAEFAPLAAAHGLELAPIPTSPRALLDSDAGRDWIQRGGRDPVAFVRWFRRLVAPVLEQVLEEVWAACQGSEAIVFTALGESFTFAGLHVADALGVPYVGVSLWPDTPTRAFPAVFLADRVGDLGPLNRASHVAVERLFWQPFRTQINSWRTRLGLPALPTTGPYQRLRRDRVLQLCGYSPAVVPVPRDWPAEHPVTGYWFLDRPAGWSPPPELAAFLAAGPPVYVGFGSMIGRSADEQSALVLDALRRAGRRGLLAAGRAGLGAGPVRYHRGRAARRHPDCRRPLLRRPALLGPPSRRARRRPGPGPPAAARRRPPGRGLYRRGHRHARPRRQPRRAHSDRERRGHRHRTSARLPAPILKPLPGRSPDSLPGPFRGTLPPTRIVS